MYQERFVDKTKTTNVYLREIDIEKGVLKNANKLATYKSEGSFPYSVVFSQDQSKIGISYCTNYIPEDRRNYFGFAVFETRTLTPIWKDVQTIISSNPKIHFHYTKGFLGNDGAFYIKASTLDGNDLYTSHMARIEKNKRPFKFGFSPLKSYHIKSSTICEVNEKEELVYTGYYNKEKNKNAQGIFELKYSLKTGKVISEKKSDVFQQSFVEKFQNRSSKNKLKTLPSIYGLTVKSSLVLGNGEKLIFGEVQYSRYSEDFIVTKVNTQGEIIWNKVLPRYFLNFSMSTYHDFSTFKEGEYYYIFFLDHQKNIENALNDTKVKLKEDVNKGVLGMYKINIKTSGIEKKYLFDINKINDQKTQGFLHHKMVLLGNGTFANEIYMKKKQGSIVKFKIK